MIDNEKKPSGYAQIVKSSALLGGSSFITILFGMVRTKIVAMLLGPSGFGIMGLYSSIIDLSQAIAGMGINSSGVRQIAAAAGSGDTMRIAKTAAVLRRTAIVLGLLGATVLSIFATPISTLTFGDPGHRYDVMLLSLTLLFGAIAGGWGALLQGLRRIRDMVKVQVIGAFSATFWAALLIYSFGRSGIVPALILVYASGAVCAWWFARSIELQPVVLSREDIATEAGALLTLGFTLMLSTAIMIGIGYLIRVLLRHNVGVGGAGLYQSAWTIGGLYMGFIVQAMGTDFYPRLTAKVNDPSECNRLINEQTQVGLILGVPGIIATMVLAQYVITAFYSQKFVDAIPILRWICIGMALRLISWPLGFMVMAKGIKWLIVVSEVGWGLVHFLLALICIKSFGLQGAGIAFALSYVYHILFTLAVVRRLTAFRWSPECCRSIVLMIVLIACAFWASQRGDLMSMSIGIGLVLIGLYHSARFFIIHDLLPASMRKLLTRGAQVLPTLKGRSLI